MYMNVKDIISKIYFNQRQLTEKDYRASRNLSIFEGGSARAVFTLTSGAFLAGFIKYLGAGDQFNGIIGAIPVLAGIIQIFSPMVFEKIERRKFLISILCFVHRFMLGLMVFVPLIIKDTKVCLGTIAVMYFVSYLMVSFITPAASNWISDLTPNNIRGKYFGLRESYILAFVTVLTLVMGKIMDIFKQHQNEYTGFLIVFITVIVFSIVNFFLLSAMKEPPVKTANISLDIRSILTIPIKDRRFRKIIIMFLIWNIGVQVAGPFFSVYMVTGLKLDYTYIMAMGMLATIVSVIAVRIWGKIADRRSWVFTTKVSISMLASSHILWFLVNEITSPVLIPVLHVLSGAGWAGIGISLFNIQFQFSPDQGRTIYLGFIAAIGGLVGFASTLAGSVLLGLLSGVKLNFLGVTVGNMQMIFAVSGFMLGVCAAYVHFFIDRTENE